jgi:hypothetical protein
VVFRGITDRLIPLFAVGALLAFTMSQLGMIAHWRRQSGALESRAKLAINAVGAAATSCALAIVVVSKFTTGAWISAFVIVGFVVVFRQVKGYNERTAALRRTDGPLALSNLSSPLVVIPLRRLDRVGEKALRFALMISKDVRVVQVQAEEMDTDDLEAQWRERVEEPIRRAAFEPMPSLVVIRSPYRQFYERFLRWLRRLADDHPDRPVIVVIPELVHRRWYQFLLSYRATRLKAKLLLDGGPHISVLSTPWYPDDADDRARR